MSVAVNVVGDEITTDRDVLVHVVIDEFSSECQRLLVLVAYQGDDFKIKACFASAWIAYLDVLAGIFDFPVDGAT